MPGEADCWCPYGGECGGVGVGGSGSDSSDRRFSSGDSGGEVW